MLRKRLSIVWSRNFPRPTANEIESALHNVNISWTTFSQPISPTHGLSLSSCFVLLKQPIFPYSYSPKRFVAWQCFSRQSSEFVSSLSLNASVCVCFCPICSFASASNFQIRQPTAVTPAVTFQVCLNLVSEGLFVSYMRSDFSSFIVCFLVF